MPNTAINALPYPALAAGADGPAAFQALAEAVAPKLYRAEPLTGAQIAAIASPRIGHLVLNTDVARTQVWNGTAWRNVSAASSGTVSLAGLVIPLSPTYSTVAFFIGLGVEEVQLLGSITNGNNGFFNVTAVSDATKAQGISSQSGGTASCFIPTSSTDAFVTTGSGTSSAGPVGYGVNFRNFRVDPDGYLRWEWATLGAATLTLNSATARFNWSAR